MQIWRNTAKYQLKEQKDIRRSVDEWQGNFRHFYKTMVKTKFGFVKSVRLYFRIGAINGYFLTSKGTISLSRKAMFHGINCWIDNFARFGHWTARIGNSLLEVSTQRIGPIFKHQELPKTMQFSSTSRHKPEITHCWWSVLYVSFNFSWSWVRKGVQKRGTIYLWTT